MKHRIGLIAHVLAAFAAIAGTMGGSVLAQTSGQGNSGQGSMAPGGRTQSNVTTETPLTPEQKAARERMLDRVNPPGPKIPDGPLAKGTKGVAPESAPGAAPNRP